MLDPREYRLDGISPRAYQHPTDRAATASLQKIPHFDDVVRRVLKLGERRRRSELLASGVRLGERQLPEVWRLHRQAFEALDIEDVPELYLTANPFANAWTAGTSRPIVTVFSQLVDTMDDDGLGAIFAHEAAHIHCGHSLYKSALADLVWLGELAAPAAFALPMFAVKCALLEWSRAAELSCDRGAALVTRSPDAVCQALLALAAGTAATRLDLEVFVEQGIEYETGGEGLDRIDRRFRGLGSTHPLPVRRVRALMDWVQSGAFDRIVDGDYIRVGEESVDEADHAAMRDARRIDDLARDAEASLAAMEDEIDAWLRDDDPEAAGDDGM